MTSKESTRFIEKLMLIIGVNFIHDNFKSIVYGDQNPETKDEQFIKSVYDAYKYLLNNRKTSLSAYLIKRFYYLLLGEVISDDKILQIQSEFYKPSIDTPIEKIIDFHFKVYEIFYNTTERVQTLIAFMFLNYLFYSFDLVPVTIFQSQFEHYNQMKEEYLSGNKIVVYEYFLNLMANEKVIPKSYYDNLIPINFSEIYQKIQSEKETLNELYNIESVAIFGSFVKESQRIDSDIDLLITFMPEMTFDEKKRKLDEAEAFLSYKLNRFIDVQEFNKFILEDMVHAIKNVKIVF